MLAGTEYEESFALTADQAAMAPRATNQNHAGDVSVFAPSGDIHRITNPADVPVIQLHVYGTDVGRLGTSVRRIYDLPIRSSSAQARLRRGRGGLVGGSPYSHYFDWNT